MSKGNIRGLVFGLVWGVVGIALAGVAYPPGGAGGVADGADLTLGDVTVSSLASDDATLEFKNSSGSQTATMSAGSLAVYNTASFAKASLGTAGVAVTSGAEYVWAASVTASNGTKDTFIGRNAAGEVYVGATTGTADGTLSTGTFLAGDGTAGAPSVAFSSDPDTGIYSTGVGKVSIATAGAERILITTGGIAPTLDIFMAVGKDIQLKDAGNLIVGTGNDVYLSGNETDATLSIGSTADDTDGVLNTSTGKVNTAGLLLGLVSKTAAYTATATDHTIICDATSGAFTVTLPPATGLSGTVYVIKKIDAANTVTLDGNASETIDGATTQALTTQYDSVTIQCDGTGWHIL